MLQHEKKLIREDTKKHAVWYWGTLFNMLLVVAKLLYERYTIGPHFESMESHVQRSASHMTRWKAAHTKAIKQGKYLVKTCGMPLENSPESAYFTSPPHL